MPKNPEQDKIYTYIALSYINNENFIEVNLFFNLKLLFGKAEKLY